MTYANNPLDRRHDALVSFGWQARPPAFWPPVLHLVYMLPLPGLPLLARCRSSLQLASRPSLASGLIRLAWACPVFLDGNIIDLGVLKLHVAEACSGLRYLFPILSFSATSSTVILYRGPVWHKAVLLIWRQPRSPS